MRHDPANPVRLRCLSHPTRTGDNMIRRYHLYLLVAAIALGSWTAARAGIRIKDITDLDGARSNQLVGFGLVVGLEGSGSKSLFTQQVAVDMLQRFNVSAKT